MFSERLNALSTSHRKAADCGLQRQPTKTARERVIRRGLRSYCGKMADLRSQHLSAFGRCRMVR